MLGLALLEGELIVLVFLVMESEWWFVGGSGLASFPFATDSHWSECHDLDYQPLALQVVRQLLCTNKPE